MKKSVSESVGEKFNVDLLRVARDKSVEVIQTVARQVRPGMTADDLKALLKTAQEAVGMPTNWHPPQVRLGMDTLLGFGHKGRKDPVLGEDDIFFLDIGPIFEGHEGDVGRTFAVGKDSDMKRCAVDVEAIWHEVRDHWRQGAITGNALYRFAEARSAERGWQLTLDQANGHRVADFPHTVRRRGTIEGFAGHPAADRWILEIQIRHPSRPFGAFYEDLLN